MNIHEAVLQPIAAFVYCNRQAAAEQQTVAGRQKSEISARLQAPAQLTPPISGVSLKLFYGGTTRKIK